LVNEKWLDKQERKALALWVADCAEHVLPYFEEKYPKERSTSQSRRSGARLGTWRDNVRRSARCRPEVRTVTARSRAESPRIPAMAYCQRTPLRNEIEAHGASRLEEATEFAAEAIARRFGPGAVDGKIQAQIVTAVK